jgi:hypothetical protein
MGRVCDSFALSLVGRADISALGAVGSPELEGTDHCSNDDQGSLRNLADLIK